MKRILLFALVAGICSAQDNKTHAFDGVSLNFTGLQHRPFVAERILSVSISAQTTSTDQYGNLVIPGLDCKVIGDRLFCDPQKPLNYGECVTVSGVVFCPDPQFRESNWKPLGISLGVESTGLFVSHKMVAYIDHRESLWMLYGTDQKLLSRWDDLGAAKAEAERLFGGSAAPSIQTCWYSMQCGVTVGPAGPYFGTADMLGHVMIDAGGNLTVNPR